MAPADPRAPSSTPSAPNKTLTEIRSQLPLRFDPPAPPNQAGIETITSNVYDTVKLDARPTARLDVGGEALSSRAPAGREAGRPTRGPKRAPTPFI